MVVGNSTFPVFKISSTKSIAFEILKDKHHMFGRHLFMIILTVSLSLSVVQINSRQSQLNVNYTGAQIIP